MLSVARYSIIAARVENELRLISIVKNNTECNLLQLASEFRKWEVIRENGVAGYIKGGTQIDAGPRSPISLLCRRLAAKTFLFVFFVFLFICIYICIINVHLASRPNLSLLVEN